MFGVEGGAPGGSGLGLSTHDGWNSGAAICGFEYTMEEETERLAQQGYTGKELQTKAAESATILHNKRMKMDIRSYTEEVKRQGDNVTEWTIKDGRLYQEDYDIYMDDMLERTRRYAEESGEHNLYNADEHKAMLAMEDMIVSGTADSVLYPTWHPNGVRYMPLMVREGNKVLNTYIDVSRGYRDFTTEEATSLLDTIGKRYGLQTQTSGTEYPFLVSKNRIAYTDVKQAATKMVESKQYEEIKSKLQTPQVYDDRVVPGEEKPLEHPILWEQKKSNTTGLPKEPKLPFSVGVVTKESFVDGNVRPVRLPIFEAFKRFVKKEEEAKKTVQVKAAKEGEKEQKKKEIHQKDNKIEETPTQKTNQSTIIEKSAVTSKIPIKEIKSEEGALVLSAKDKLVVVAVLEAGIVKPEEAGVLPFLLLAALEKPQLQEGMNTPASEKPVVPVEQQEGFVEIRMKEIQQEGESKSITLVVVDSGKEVPVTLELNEKREKQFNSLHEHYETLKTLAAFITQREKKGNGEARQLPGETVTFTKPSREVRLFTEELSSWTRLLFAWELFSYFAEVKELLKELKEKGNSEETEEDSYPLYIFSSIICHYLALIREQGKPTAPQQTNQQKKQQRIARSGVLYLYKDEFIAL
jgi:hypothetical protein